MRLHLIRSVAQQMLPGNCFSPEGAGPEERASPFSLAPCPCSASSDSHPTVEDVPSCHELHFRCRVDLLSWKQGCFDAPPFAPSYGNNTKWAMKVGESRSLSVARLRSQRAQTHEEMQISTLSRCERTTSINSQAPWSLGPALALPRVPN